MGTQWLQPAVQERSPLKPLQYQSKAAHHYRIAGDLQRDIWFDDDGEMVKLAFLGQDGSKVVYLVQ